MSKNFLQERKIDRKTLHGMSHDELLDFATKNLKKIGEGGFRAVFALDSRYALKIAFKDFGNDQNKTEFEISKKETGLVPMTYDHAVDFSWMISDLVRPLTDMEEFEDLTGIYWRTFESSLRGASYGAAARNREIDALPQESKDFLNSVRAFMHREKLYYSDVAWLGHWGKTADGKLVLIDAGMRDDNLMHLSKEGKEELKDCLREFINEVVKKCGDDWCLYTQKTNGKRRRLGTHKTKKDAINQEIAIQYSKKRS